MLLGEVKPDTRQLQSQVAAYVTNIAATNDKFHIWHADLQLQVSVNRILRPLSLLPTVTLSLTLVAMSTNSDECPEDPQRLLVDSLKLENARLHAELKRARINKLKLSHELERVKSDRNILEQYSNDRGNDDSRDSSSNIVSLDILPCLFGNWRNSRPESLKDVHDQLGTQRKSEQYYNFQLRRLKADIKVLENYRDEFHQHLENNCSCLRDNISQTVQQQNTSLLVPVQPSQPMTPDQGITIKTEVLATSSS